MKEILEKVAQDPQASWQRFKIAVVLFIIAVGLIILGAETYHLLQIPGLLILGAALFFAAWGYFGILGHRLLEMQASWEKKQKKHRNKP